MRVDVALSVAELARAVVARVAELLRRPEVAALENVARRFLERDVARVRLRRPREVDRGLGEVEARLGKADVLERMRRRDGDEQGAGVGVADVLGSEHDHPPNDVARVLAGLDHRREVVDGGVGIRPAQRLDERGDRVVVAIAALVVDERALRRSVFDVTRLEPRVFGARRLHRELENRERVAGIATGELGNERLDLRLDFDVELGRAAPDDQLQLVQVQRLELVELRARKERRVDLEVRVLRRRADQRDHALLDRRQQRVLLSLVEAVDLVEEENRPLSLGAEPLPCAGDHFAHLRDRRRHRGQLLERGAGRVRDDAGERRLAAPGRAVEHHRAHAVLLDRESKSRAGAEHVLLADELVERLRPQPKRERSDLRDALSSGIGEEVAHTGSMLRSGTVTEVEDFSKPILPGRPPATTSAICARTSCSRSRRRPTRSRIATRSSS